MGRHAGELPSRGLVTSVGLGVGLGEGRLASLHTQVSSWEATEMSSQQPGD